MAISRERLEELIKQGSTVYEVVYRYKSNNIEEYDLKDIPTYSKNHLDHFLDMHEVFETKEDAEEFAEFGNITRTERLELPSWEEFNSTKFSFDFMGKNQQQYRVHCVEDEIWICEDFGGIVLNKPLTREDYNDARRLCVKLFKGEEV